MTMTSWPYVAQDVTDIQYSKLMKEYGLSGVTVRNSTNLQLYADGTGLQSKIKAGQALIRGYMFDNTADIIVPHDAPAGTGRLDRVVLELNVSAPSIADRIKPKVLKGTASAAPLPTRDPTGVWQISLGTVSVGSSAVTIVAGDVLVDRDYASAPVGYWMDDDHRPIEEAEVGMLGFNVSRAAWEYFSGGTTWLALAPVVTWGTITGKPTTFPPSTHGHNATDITTGVLALARIPVLTSAYLANDSVGSAQLADNSVGAAAIAANAVGNSELATGSVTNAKLGTGAVTTVKLADESVGYDQIGGTLKDGINSLGDASALNRGTVAAARIPGLDASKITSGTIGRPVNSPGTVVAAGDIGCNGRMQSVGSRNWTVVNNYVSAYMDASGYFGASPSARRFKQDIQPWQEDVIKLLNIEPKVYHLRKEVDLLGDEAPWRIGFIAEDLIDAGLDELVPLVSDEEDEEFGLPISINYEFYVVVLQMIVRNLATRLAVVEEKVGI